MVINFNKELRTALDVDSSEEKTSTFANWEQLKWLSQRNWSKRLSALIHLTIRILHQIKKIFKTIHNCGWLIRKAIRFQPNMILIALRKQLKAIASIRIGKAKRFHLLISLPLTLARSLSPPLSAVCIYTFHLIIDWGRSVCVLLCAEKTRENRRERELFPFDCSLLWWYPSRTCRQFAEGNCMACARQFLESMTWV